MVFTTEKFQVLPNFYNHPSEFKGYNIINTNPRYDNFKQTHFTAGDMEQFNRFRDYTNNFEKKEIDLSQNVFNDLEITELNWEKYQNISTETIHQTFMYIFYKFKKGIYVKIQNNEIKVFLPFSNVEFTNEYAHLLNADPKYENFEEMIRVMCETSNIPFNPKHINKNPKHWYANDFLVRFEYPTKEGDAGVSQMKDLLDELVKTRDVPDCDFFINRRDMPLLTNNGTEAYKTIFGEIPMISHNYDKYCPIFSMVGRDNFADIPFPTWDDWNYANQHKYFSDMKKVDYIFNTEWKDKIPKAVFRGSTTGEGYDEETNVRLKLCSMKSEHLDVGITKFFNVPRKVRGKPYFTIMNRPELVSPLSPYEQSKYKYVINVDGNVRSFRLTQEMKYGSVVLLSNSDYRLWYEKFMIPYKHYVPIKRDLSDLMEKIEWCLENDAECERIAKNAIEFYDAYLSRSRILDYVQKLLVDVKKHTGDYYYNSVQYVDYMLENEKKMLASYFEELKDDKKVINPTLLENDYGSCKVMEKLVYNNIDKIKVLNTFLEAGMKYLEVGQIFGKTVIIKKNKMLNHNIKPLQERIHEGYVTVFGTNKLRQEIPNFKYTYYSNTDFTVTEYINGLTLSEWIKKEFDFYTYLNIMKMVILSIKVAQERIGFVHWDLYPWNIIIKKLDRQETIYYNVSPEQVYKVTTNIIPVIIDFGKSHVVSDGMHHGFIHMFHMNSYQDIYTFFATTLHEILKAPTTHLKTILEIANTVFFKKFEKLRDLKEFLYDAKKFSNILMQKDMFMDKNILDILLDTHLKNIQKLDKYMIQYKDPDVLYALITGTRPDLKISDDYFEYLEKSIGLDNLNYENDVTVRYKKEPIHFSQDISIDLYRMNDYSYFLKKNYKNAKIYDLTNYYKYINLKEIDIPLVERKKIFDFLKLQTNFTNLRNIANKNTWVDIVENIYEKDKKMFEENKIEILNSF